MGTNSTVASRSARGFRQIHNSISARSKATNPLQRRYILHVQATREALAAPATNVWHPYQTIGHLLQVAEGTPAPALRASFHNLASRGHSTLPARIRLFQTLTVLRSADT
eukprot:3783776-Amphidinium_carterae.1